jgi:hypothetical protein
LNLYGVLRGWRVLANRRVCRDFRELLVGRAAFCTPCRIKRGTATASGRPTVGHPPREIGHFERRAKALVPLARKLDRALDLYAPAREQLIAAKSEWAQAVKELEAAAVRGEEERRTGEVVLRWIEERVFWGKADLDLPEITIHSSNPVGGSGSSGRWTPSSAEFGSRRTAARPELPNGRSALAGLAVARLPILVP